MKDTMRKLILFSFHNRTGIENYLEEQAKAGWMLDKMGDIFWHFKRMEPKEIKFSVTYFPKASYFESEPSEKQRIFQDFCEHTGWKLVGCNAQMQIYYNENTKSVPIETDPVMEVEHIHKSTKSRFLWVYIIMLMSAIVQLGTIGWYSFNNPFKMLGNNAGLLCISCIVIWIMICISDLVLYWNWYKKAKRIAQSENRFLETGNGFGLYILTICFMLMGLCFMLIWYGGNQLKVIMITGLLLLMAVGVAVIIVAFCGLIKRYRMSKNVNFIATLCVAVVLVGVVMIIEVAGAISVIEESRKSNSVTKTYEYKGHMLKEYKDPIPLKLEDLIETDYKEYSYQLKNRSSSVLMDVFEARQFPRWDALKEARVNYSLVKLHVKQLYNFSKKEMLKNLGSNYKKADAGQWGAKEVYQGYFDGDAQQEYVVCYEDTIMYIVFENTEELSENQKISISKLLNKIEY